MTTTFLNLDEVSKGDRVVKIKGVEYPVIELSVGEFVETLKLGKKLETVTDPVDQFELNVSAIRKYIPTIPIEVLNGLSLDQLRALSDFARGELPGNEEAGENPTQGPANQSQ